MQHYLGYAIDYFTRDELSHFQYAIISAKITDGHRVLNCVRFNEFYPDTDTLYAYTTTGDKKILEKKYREMLAPENHTRLDTEYAAHINAAIYKAFIIPLMNHVDVFIMCDKTENDYIDVLCKCLKDYAIEVIDLNQLFDTGRVGPIYLDRNEVRDKAVELNRAATQEEIDSLYTTRDGRAKLITQMSKEQKIEKLKNYGVKLKKSDIKNIDKMLYDIWCDDDETLLI